MDQIISVVTSPLTLVATVTAFAVTIKAVGAYARRVGDGD